jgi:hypothetical protein
MWKRVRSLVEDAPGKEIVVGKQDRIFGGRFC